MSIFSSILSIVDKLIPAKSAPKAESTTTTTPTPAEPSAGDKAQSGLKGILSLITKPLTDKILKPLALKYGLSDETVMMLGFTIIIVGVVVCLSLVMIVLAIKI